MLAEQLARVSEDVRSIEVERVGNAVEHQHVVLDHEPSPLSRASRNGSSFSNGSLSFSRADSLIRSGVHVGSQTTSTSTLSTVEQSPDFFRNHLQQAGGERAPARR